VTGQPDHAAERENATLREALRWIAKEAEGGMRPDVLRADILRRIRDRALASLPEPDNEEGA